MSAEEVGEISPTSSGAALGPAKRTMEGKQVRGKGESCYSARCFLCDCVYALFFHDEKFCYIWVLLYTPLFTVLVAPDIPIHERKNWLIHLHYVRKDFETCKVHGCRVLHRLYTCVYVLNKALYTASWLKGLIFLNLKAAYSRQRLWLL